MIPQELEPLLEPLEAFESLRRRVVRMGDRLCDLSYANPYAGVGADVKAALRQALDEERQLGLQYSPFGGQTLVRRRVAEALVASHALPFRFDDVVLTPGAMSALQLALRSVGGPGDEVILPIPCWLDYPLYIRSLGMVPVPVAQTPGAFDLDAEAVRDAVTSRTCAVLFAHPGNPTGRSYDLHVLRGLAEAVRDAEQRTGRPITVITDETHRDFTAAGTYTSASRLLDRVLLVYSFGKYHFIQGQRLGYVAVSPAHPARRAVGRELVRWTRITGTATPTSLMQRAALRLLALHHDQEWLVRWRERMACSLGEQGYEVVPANATLFLYVRTPDACSDFEFTATLASRGVLVLPAPVFHHQGYFRLALTGSEGMLERALDVMRGFP